MKFKKSQILSWKIQKVSCSGKSCIQKFTWILLFRQMDKFAPFVFFYWHYFEKKTVCTVSELSSENHNVLDAELKVLQRVKSWIDELPTCQILYERSHNVSFSEIPNLKRVRCCFKSFTTCKILSRNNYIVSGLKLKNL